MIDLEPAKLYTNGQGRSKTSLAGEYQGLPLQATDIPKRNPRRPNYFRKQNEAAILRHKTPSPPPENANFAAQGEIREEFHDHGKGHSRRKEKAPRTKSTDIPASAKATNNTPRSQSTYTPIEQQFNDLQVKIKLAPAIILLAHPEKLDEAETREAADYARGASRLAHTIEASQAIRARCAYYIGLAEWWLIALSGESPRPGSSHSDSSWRAPDLRPLQYFQTALGAKGKYKEGKWAEKWVDYLLKRDQKSEEDRPGSSDSWVGRIFGAFFGKKGTSPPSDEFESKRASWLSKAKTKQDDPDSPPSSQSSPRIHDSEEHFSDNISRGKASKQDWGMRNRTSLSHTSSTEVQDERSPSLDQPLLPVHVFHTPLTSPTKESPTTSPRSVTFTSDTKEASKHGDGPDSPSIYHRRNRSLSSLIARRDRTPSEVEQMEEGNSPFMATFGDDVSKRLR